MKASAVLVAALLVTSAQARCLTDDAWQGRDKSIHFGGGAVIGATVTAVTGEPLYGFAAGTIAGAFIEARDSRIGKVCSLQDFAATAAGAAVGAYGWHFIIAPNFIGYHTKF